MLSDIPRCPINLWALTCLLMVAVDLYAAPLVVCGKPVYEFVSSNGAASIVHEFEVANAGDVPLVIENVRACCGATVKVSLKTVPPASNTVLEVSLDLRGKSGKIRKSIYLQTNDPDRPVVPLRLIGEVGAKGGKP